MSAPPADQETVLVDVSDLPIAELLSNDETPLAEALRWLDSEAQRRGDAVAGFQSAV